MTNIVLKTTLLSLFITLISCKKEIESKLEVDYKVVEVDYGFDNYLKNIHDKSEGLIIKQRNLVLIDVDKDGKMKIEKKSVTDSLIVEELKKYITPNPNNIEMPITVEKEFQLSGKVNINKNMIVLGIFDNDLNYEKYREIRNKIYLSFTEVQNEFSLKKFNQTLQELIHSSKEEDIIKWQEIRQIFPIRYTETVKEK